MRVNVKKLRKSLKLTQNEFSEKLGCAQTYLCLLESKNKSTTPEMYSRLCNTFGKETVDSFIEPELPPKEKNQSTDSNAERDYLLEIIASQKKQIDDLIATNKTLVEAFSKISGKVG